MANKKTTAADYLGLKTERKGFTIVWDDFLESKVLDYYEKLVFITLKKFADNDTLVCFPSLNTLHDITGISKSKIQTVISSLESKKVLEVKHREDSDKGHQSNLYTLYDYAEMWTSDENADTAPPGEGQRDTIRMINILRAQGYTITKEKEPASAKPTKAADSDSRQNQISAKDNKTSSESCQDSVSERYTMDQIHQIYDYDVMVFDYPSLKKDIETVMHVLYDALNTRKPTIRIDGEDKPAMIVVSKLMKLDKDSILYAIRKYRDQTDRIRNVTAYMLTMLYHAPEQYRLDLQNLFSHNQAGI